MKLRWVTKNEKQVLQYREMIWFILPSFVYRWVDVPVACPMCDSEECK